MADFDAYSDSYRDSVTQSIAFCGQELEYFTRRKVDHLLDVTTRRLDDPMRCSFLDVGCGVGTTDSLLAEHVGALHGVDIAAEAVERAADCNPGVSYQSYDGQSFPYDDATMDVVFAICVLHHVALTDRSNFAKELRRVVRPGGIVVLFEHNPYNPLTRAAVNRCEFDDDAVLLPRRTSITLLREAALTPIEARYIVFLPFSHPAVSRVERPMHWLPLGAQHYVAARR